MSEVEQSTAATVATLVKDLYRPASVVFEPAAAGTVPVMVLPEGMHIESCLPMLDARAAHPHRQQGTITAHTLSSLLALTGRFARAGTTVYVDVDERGAGEVLTVFDHHEGMTAGHAGFRALHKLKASAAFLVWSSKGTQWMKQREFAEFLEDRMMDLVAVDANSPLAPVASMMFTRFADPTEVRVAARGLSLKVEQEVTNAVTLETGEVSVVFAEKHSRQGGAVEVPKLFAVQCPVWEQGAAYQIPVKMRYRVNGGAVEWNVQALMLDRVVAHAVEALAASVEEGVKAFAVPVPVVRGKY